MYINILVQFLAHSKCPHPGPPIGANEKQKAKGSWNKEKKAKSLA